jgi:hypothetical protein
VANVDSPPTDFQFLRPSMSSVGRLDGPALGGFSGGDISLSAPFTPSQARSRGRAHTNSSGRPLSRRSVTPTVARHDAGAPQNGEQEEETGIHSNSSNEDTIAEDDTAEDDQEDLMVKATQPVTGLRMR